MCMFMLLVKTFSLCFTLTVCSTGNRWAFCDTILPPLSSQQKRLDQATVTSIHCQGHWFQPIWRRQVIIFKCESIQYRKGKLTRSQWSSTVSILTPATHIWGAQQKDAIKLKQKKKKTQTSIAAEQQRDSPSATAESHIAAQLHSLVLYIFLLLCFVSGFIQLSVEETDCGSLTDTLWQVIYFH